GSLLLYSEQTRLVARMSGQQRQCPSTMRQLPGRLSRLHGKRHFLERGERTLTAVPSATRGAGETGPFLLCKFAEGSVFGLDEDRLLVFASTGRAPTNPDWYHNLLAHPEVTVEVGNETNDAIATPVTGEERDRIYARWAEMYPQYGEYQRNTTRKIPVIALQRRKGKG